MMLSASSAVTGTRNTSSRVADGFSARSCIIRSFRGGGSSRGTPPKLIAVFSASALVALADRSPSAFLLKLNMYSRAESGVGLWHSGAAADE